MKKFFIGNAAMALAVAAATGVAVMPMAVFAEDGVQDPSAETPKNGVQDPSTETPKNGVQEPGGEVRSSDGTWSPNGHGEIDLQYSTRGGKWTDSTGAQHDNGTFVVRIPKKIRYKNMNAGKVDTSDDYDVTVEGVLTGGASVVVMATTGTKVTGTGMLGDVTGTGMLGDITETTSLVDGTAGGTAGEYSETNKHTFTGAQVSVMNEDRTKVIGTTVKDNIKLQGTALSEDLYTGTVQYTAYVPQEIR